VPGPARPDVPAAAVAEATALADRAGLPVDGDGLLARALVHRSWAYEQGGVVPNERLEFLGDAVLSLAVAEALYSALPDDQEGTLARVRGQAVRESELADAARRIGLGDHVLLGVGEAASGGADKDSILADAFEAVLGAVHLEAGWETARRLIDGLMGDRLHALASGDTILDHKTALQELLARGDGPEPVYTWTADGPDHAKTFTAVVSLDDVAMGSGSGTSRKRAEEAAAAAAWRRLHEDDEPAGATDGTSGPED
jgi:ribonuclease-3